MALPSPLPAVKKMWVPASCRKNLQVSLLLLFFGQLQCEYVFQETLKMSWEFKLHQLTFLYVTNWWMFQAKWQYRDAWRPQWTRPSLWPAVFRGVRVNRWGRSSGWTHRTRHCWATILETETAWVDSSTWNSFLPRRTPQPSRSVGWASVMKVATPAFFTCIQLELNRVTCVSLLPVSKAVCQVRTLQEAGSQNIINNIKC